MWGDPAIADRGPAPIMPPHDRGRCKPVLDGRLGLPGGVGRGDGSGGAGGSDPPGRGTGGRARDRRPGRRSAESDRPAGRCGFARPPRACLGSGGQIRRTRIAGSPLDWGNLYRCNATAFRAGPDRPGRSRRLGDLDLRQRPGRSSASCPPLRRSRLGRQIPDNHRFTLRLGSVLPSTPRACSRRHTPGIHRRSF